MANLQWPFDEPDNPPVGVLMPHLLPPQTPSFPSGPQSLLGLVPQREIEATGRQHPHFTLENTPVLPSKPLVLAEPKSWLCSLEQADTHLRPLLGWHPYSLL